MNESGNRIFEHAQGLLGNNLAELVLFAQTREFVTMSASEAEPKA